MLIAFMTSCSLLDKSPLTPPDWAMGSWSDDYDILTWEFASDNVLYHSESLDMDYKALALNPGVEITDEIGDDSYSFTYKTETTSTEYGFEFVDDTTMNYSLNGGTAVVLHKD